MALAPAVDPTTLDVVARRALDDAGARVTSWSMSRLPGGMGNPTTAGLARYSGVADCEGIEQSWSVVRKDLRIPSDIPAAKGARHPLYWRREADAYASGFLAGLPGGVVAPRLLRRDDAALDSVTLWLEDVGPMDQRWDETSRRAAIVHLARFHAAYLTGTPIPGFPWMGLHVARQWLDTLWPLAERGIAAVRGTSRALAPLVALLDDPVPALDALESAPQTLCHHDPNPDNLLVRSGETGLVAIDWQMIGRGPVGEDIAQFLSGLIDSARPEDRDHLESTSLAAYHRALMSAGVPMSLGDVHRGYYCAGALRQGVFAFYLLGEQLAAAGTPEAARTVVEEFIRRTRHGHLPALATRARMLTAG